MGQVTDTFNITINEPALKAFPEATGFGAYGIDLTPNLGAWSKYHQSGNLADRPDVYEVTNGNLSGAGSIFDALATQSGPRIIIINTDAKLLLTSTLNIIEDYTTIYRVTAGGAFALTGFKFQVEASYVIIRRLSFYNNSNNDSLAITAVSARPQPKYIIVDEYNAGWNQDEASATNASFSITGRHIQDFTFSRGLIFDGIDPSSPKGALLNGTNHVTRGTIDRIAFINQNQRNPKVSGRDTDPGDPGQGSGSFPPTLLPFQVAHHDISNIISYNVGQRHFIMNGGAKVNLRAYKQINGPDTIGGNPVLYITTEDWLTPTIEPVATNEQYTGLYYQDIEIEAGMVELSMVYDKSSPTSWGAEGTTRFIESSEIIEAMAPVRPSLLLPANLLAESANWGGGDDWLALAARTDLNSGTGTLKSGQNFDFNTLEIPQGTPKSLAGEPTVTSVNDIPNHLAWLNGLLTPATSMVLDTPSISVSVESATSLGVNVDGIPEKVYILGSSTSFGLNATAGNSWAELFSNYMTTNYNGAQVINLAVQIGHDTAAIQSGQTPGFDVDTVLADANATMCIINLPSNDVFEGVITLAQTIANLTTVRNQLAANGVKTIFTTTQPRNGTAGQQNDQIQSAQDIRDAFRVDVIDIFGELANPDGTIKAIYNSGDNIHLNDAGHLYLANTAIAKIEEHLVRKSKPDQYRIYRDTVLVHTTTGPYTRWIDTGLTTSQNYTYTVESLTNGVASTLSGGVTDNPRSLTLISINFGGIDGDPSDPGWTYVGDEPNSNPVVNNMGGTGLNLTTGPDWGFAAGGTGRGSNGSGNTTVVPPAVGKEYWFVDNDTATITISNIPNGTYDVRVGASRQASGTRITDYTIGATTLSLEAINNTANEVVFTGVVVAAGTIQLDVVNTNNQFGYLGWLVLEEPP